MSTTRTVSITVEAEITVENKADLVAATARLTELAERAVKSDYHTTQVWFGSPIVHRPSPGQEKLA